MLVAHWSLYIYITTIFCNILTVCESSIPFIISQIATESDGKTWSEATSSARNHTPAGRGVSAGLKTSAQANTGSGFSNSQSSSNGINSMDDLESFLGKSK